MTGKPNVYVRAKTVRVDLDKESTDGSETVTVVLEGTIGQVEDIRVGRLRGQSALRVFLVVAWRPVMSRTVAFDGQMTETSIGSWTETAVHPEEVDLYQGDLLRLTEVP